MYTLLSVVNFGLGFVGLSGGAGSGQVGYKFWNAETHAYSDRIDTGIYEITPGQYAARVNHDDGFVGAEIWDTGGDDPIYLINTINPQTAENMDEKVSLVSTSPIVSLTERSNDKTILGGTKGVDVRPVAAINVRTRVVRPAMPVGLTRDRIQR